MSETQKKICKKLFIYLPLGLLLLFTLANLYLGINKAVTHNPVPKVGGLAPLVVLSGSMEPAIYPGDVVIIREQKVEQYKIGDVVTYLDGQTVFTHRIVGVEEGMFVLQGDNNNTVDDTVHPEQLAGKVLLTIPKIGVAMVFIKRPAGMAVLALVLLLYVFSGDILEKVGKGRHRAGRGEDR
ncbi:MAG: signal peptidase I [Peptococcaceae bacterium]|nr:signal peptidase I [Candidatus Syntrophopropionicum ammoniitolerans]